MLLAVGSATIEVNPSKSRGECKRTALEEECVDADFRSEGTIILPLARVVIGAVERKNIIACVGDQQLRPETRAIHPRKSVWMYARFERYRLLMDPRCATLNFIHLELDGGVIDNVFCAN